MADKMIITVLPDGSLKIETDKVSMPNHTNAEGLIRAITADVGPMIRKAKHGHVHSHDHDHDHDHN
jgi:hypothetical protein